MSVQDAMAAEAAALRGYQERSSRTILGIKLKRGGRSGYRTPGIDTTMLFADPCCILKNADSRRASGDMYLWRKPDDSYTKSMCLRGLIRPVLTDELDDESPYANVDRAKIITKVGPREVVRSPGGMGLFVASANRKPTNQDLGLLPGEQWEDKYLEDLAENQDQYEAGLEKISAASMQGRVSGDISSTDTKREIIG